MTLITVICSDLEPLQSSLSAPAQHALRISGCVFNHQQLLSNVGSRKNGPSREIPCDESRKLPVSSEKKNHGSKYRQSLARKFSRPLSGGERPLLINNIERSPDPLSSSAHAAIPHHWLPSPSAPDGVIHGRMVNLAPCGSPESLLLA